MKLMFILVLTLAMPVQAKRLNKSKTAYSGEGTYEERRKAGNETLKK